MGETDLCQVEGDDAVLHVVVRGAISDNGDMKQGPEGSEEANC